MITYVALLRAINVGGSGKLPMSELAALCEKLGFAGVTTYIQSGNVVFQADGTESQVASQLDEALTAVLGKAPGVFVRTPEELEAVLSNNPFPSQQPNQVLVHFFGETLPDTALSGLVAPAGEEAVVRGREIYVHYPIGSGRSKIKLPALKAGTSRNINTVAKLAEMALRLREA